MAVAAPRIIEVAKLGAQERAALSARLAKGASPEPPSRPAPRPSSPAATPARAQVAPRRTSRAAAPSVTRLLGPRAGRGGRMLLAIAVGIITLTVLSTWTGQRFRLSFAPGASGQSPFDPAALSKLSYTPLVDPATTKKPAGTSAYTGTATPQLIPNATPPAGVNPNALPGIAEGRV